MTAFLPEAASWREDDQPYPALLERSLLREDQLLRWEVRAAQWRAHELAVAAFGPGIQMSLTGLRQHGELRGLLRLDVPFQDLHGHLEREARFMASVNADPLLTRVPLIYVVGPIED